MKRKYKRLTFVAVGLSLFGLAAALVLFALEDNIVLFRSPTDIAKDPPLPNQRFRLGGLVESDSVLREENATVKFRVTDGDQSILVVFKGILPDLFRENQGVVVEGKLDNGLFKASEVLAKHDETYMPPEVANAIKKAGKWKGVK